MKKKLFLAAAIFAFCNVSAQRFDADSSRLLENVIVTANKIEQKQMETGKVLTVITREELQQNAGRSLGEILNRQVGIVIGGASNTPGSVQSVYLRGASPANTLLLIDGIPLYDASGISSEFDLNTFLPADIERIEILKGAQSTLYGSDAVAGVINIITKKAAATKMAWHADLSGGSYGSFRGSLQLSGTSKSGFSYHAGYTKFYSDGFSSAYDSAKTGGFDNDGVNQDAWTAALGYKFSNRFQANAYVKYNRSKGGVDIGAFTDDDDYKFEINNLITGLRFNYKLPKGSLRLNLYRNDYERKYNNDSADIGGYSDDPFAFFFSFIKENYAGYSHFAEVVANLKLSASLNLVSGLEYRVQSTNQNYLYISNSGPYEPVPLSRDSANARQASAYASLLFAKNGFSAGLGGRFNHHSVYGNNGTFSVNPAYVFGNFKAFVNMASAYRVPSLYQLYSEYGNRDLKPEQSLSYEAGLQRTSSKWNARVTLFKRDIRDIFIFYTDPVTFAGKYLNEDRQADKGVEVEFAVKPNKAISVTGNFTYVDGALTTQNAQLKDTTYFNLYRRPRSILNLHADYHLGKWMMSAHFRNCSSALEPVYGASPVQLPAYFTLDLYAEFKMNKHFRFYADARNITGSQYFELRGFATRRFNVMAGVQMSF